MKPLALALALAASLAIAGCGSTKEAGPLALEFADGPFAYRVQLAGPPGRVSQKQAEEIAGKLYDRVAGSPRQA